MFWDNFGYTFENHPGVVWDPALEGCQVDRQASTEAWLSSRDKSLVTGHNGDTRPKKLGWVGKQCRGQGLQRTHRSPI